MSIRIFSIVGLILLYSCLWWKSPSEKGHRNLSRAQDSIYTVESLQRAHIPEGLRVKVRGIVTCISIRQSIGSNQPGSGCYLIPRKGASPLRSGIYIGEFQFAEYLNREVVVEGKLYYLKNNAPTKGILVIRDAKVVRVLD